MQKIDGRNFCNLKKIYDFYELILIRYKALYFTTLSISIYMVLDLFILNRIINKQLDSIFCFNDFMIFLPHNILFLLRLDGRVAVLEPGSRRRERSKTSEDLSPAVAGVGLGTGRKQDGGQIRANHFEFSKPNNLSQCSRVFFHLKEFCNIIKC